MIRESSQKEAQLTAPQHWGVILQERLGYIDGNNLYEYVSGDPIGNTDPTGLQVQVPTGAGTQQTIYNEDQISNATEYYFDLGKASRIAGYLGPAVAYDAAYGESATFAIQLAQKLREELRARCPSARPGDIEEAARHMAWQAILSTKIGGMHAKYIGDTNELGARELGKEADASRDQVHNEVGRKISFDVDRALAHTKTLRGNYGRITLSKAKQAIEVAVREAILNGRAVGIDGKPLVCEPCNEKK